MTTAQIYPALEVNANGVVYVSGTRYKVLHLAADHYQHGWTAEEILRQHPDLAPNGTHFGNKNSSGVARAIRFRGNSHYSPYGSRRYASKVSAIWLAPPA